MALIQKMEAPSGVELENGYHKISEGTLKWIESKRRWYLYYTVAHYLDRTARKSGKEPLFYSNYLMKMNGVSYEDNYSYRKLLQTKGPALFKREKPDERCASCDKPLVDTRGIY